MLRNFFPGISFIAFTPSESCDPASLFQFLHFQNTEAEINYIKTRVKYESEEKKNTERLSSELFDVLKDHDNEAVQHFVKFSSQFCYTKELSKMVYDRSDEEKEAVFGSRKLSPDNLDCRFYYPCRLVIVNEPFFGESLEIVARDLQKDGLKLFVTKLSSLLKTFQLLWCMIKIFRGGRGGDTFETPSPLRTTFAFTHPLF